MDKFIGDTVSACFGAPRNLPDHEYNGCVAAIRLQEKMAALRAELGRDSTAWPELARRLRVRVGVHSGSVLFGDLGAPGHAVFSMLGDNVNLTARLEVAAKYYSVRILCTAQTKAGCETGRPGRILFRPLDTICVKGRADQIELHEPMALHGEATDEIRECVSHFEQGRARYRQQDWAGAAELFRNSARLEPANTGSERNPSIFYLEQIERHLQAPPNLAANPQSGR